MPPSPEVLLSTGSGSHTKNLDLPDEGLYSFLAPKPPATVPLLKLASNSPTTEPGATRVSPSTLGCGYRRCATVRSAERAICTRGFGCARESIRAVCTGAVQSHRPSNRLWTGSTSGVQSEVVDGSTDGIQQPRRDEICFVYRGGVFVIHRLTENTPSARHQP